MEGDLAQAKGLFATVGGALFRRAVHLLGDDPVAVQAAQDLFVRFVVHGRVQMLDTRARWAWIYRVGTTHCLRLLPDDARPGGHLTGQAIRPGSVLSVPAMGALRRFDEATRTIVVLATLDGLGPDEIAEVVGLPPKLVRRRIADSAPRSKTGASPLAVGVTHPSLLALDRDRSSHADHLTGCAPCRQVADFADGLVDRFAREIVPATAARVAAALRVENARRTSGPGWKRALWLGGGLVLVSLLALMVARPRPPNRLDVPYAGLKGASRATGSGIQITVARGEEVRALAPGVVLQSGDHLRFRVRSERPRYLELRVRGMSGDERVFPQVGTESVMVRPGQALARDYVVGTREDKIWIVGLFSDRPFTIDSAPGPDTEVVPVRAEVQR